MRSGTQLLLILFFTSGAGLCQTGQTQRGTNDTKKQLPVLHDWFLSTGAGKNDPSLYVCEFGTGRDTIVMLHGGWGADYSTLIDAIRKIEGHYHFIFYDQRGSLRSPFPDSLITFSNHIEDLERLRLELGLEKLRIVGHSMGAVLASAYASRYPQRVKQLVLLAPAYLKDPIPAEDQRLLEETRPLFDAFLERPSVTQELNRYALLRKETPLSSREETSRSRIEFARRMIYDISKWPQLTGGGALYKANVFELTAKTYPEKGWNYLEDFTKGSYPVSIIMGDHDFLDFNNQLTKKWAKGIAAVQLRIIKNAGHIIWVDQPDTFSKELLHELEKSK